MSMTVCESTESAEKLFVRAALLRARRMASEGGDALRCWCCWGGSEAMASGAECCAHEVESEQRAREVRTLVQGRRSGERVVRAHQFVPC